MAPLKAQVHNGRLVLDAPTDLPEGEVVYLVPADGLVTEIDDGMSHVEAAELQRELEASIAEADAGETEDFTEFLARLRAVSL